ncbi:MAG: hypothetical protein M4579_001376 [Chaenotheca gracillima]|nr:MAG: hypothetical protein M4579_001376 [Chaenotheca gracillima]
MAPSEAMEKRDPETSVAFAASNKVTKSKDASKSAEGTITNPVMKDSSKGTPNISNDSKTEEISPAERKKRAKEEKQARRTKEKEAREGASGAAALGKDQRKAHLEDGNKSKAQNNQAENEPKGHHKRHGSTSIQAQKSLPIRPAKVTSTPSTEGRPTENKNVALFGHLYSQPRRTSISGAGKEIHPAVLALGIQMSSYVVCGSNARCVAMLLVFKKVIESYVTPAGTTLTRHLTSHLSPQIEYLKSCRPLSISMGNAIRWLKLEISKVDIDVPDTDSKSYLCNAIDTFIRERITLADAVIATAAASKIQNGDVILTYAKSSIVQQTLLTAHGRGTQFRVIVVDSNPLFEGKHLARALANAGVEVQYSLLHGVGHAIKDASKVFLGAHAMMGNGRLFSRVGTAIVAMMASEVDVPVIVCCESVKFTDRVALDSIVNNEIAPPDELLARSSNSSSEHPLSNWRQTPNLQLLNVMYDVAPAELIKMVITEYGSLPPSSVPVVHRLSTNS